MKIVLSVLWLLTTCSLAVSDEPPVIPAKNHLICYFACDDAVENRAVDSTGSGVKAIHSGDTPSLVEGPFGNALCCFGNGNQDIYRYGLDLEKTILRLPFGSMLLIMLVATEAWWCTVITLTFRFFLTIRERLPWKCPMPTMLR